MIDAKTGTPQTENVWLAAENDAHMRNTISAQIDSYSPIATFWTPQMTTPIGPPRHAPIDSPIRISEAPLMGTLTEQHKAENHVWGQLCPWTDYQVTFLFTNILAMGIGRRKPVIIPNLVKIKICISVHCQYDCLYHGLPESTLRKRMPMCFPKIRQLWVFFAIMRKDLWRASVIETSVCTWRSFF